MTESPQVKFVNGIIAREANSSTRIVSGAGGSNLLSRESEGRDISYVNRREATGNQRGARGSGGASTRGPLNQAESVSVRAEDSRSGACHRRSNTPAPRGYSPVP